MALLHAGKLRRAVKRDGRWAIDVDELEAFYRRVDEQRNHRRSLLDGNRNHNRKVGDQKLASARRPGLGF